MPRHRRGIVEEGFGGSGWSVASLTVSAEAGFEMLGILSQTRTKAKKLLITTEKHELFIMHLEY